MAGNPRLVDYCSSKYAALGFSETLQIELAKRGMDDLIQTSVVCPFFINTGMFDGTSTGTILGRLFGMVMLEESYVVQKIIDECVLGQVDNLCVPKFIYLVPILKCLLPHKLRIFASKLLGALDALDNMTGSKSAKNNVKTGAITDVAERQRVMELNGRAGSK